MLLDIVMCIIAVGCMAGDDLLRLAVEQSSYFQYFMAAACVTLVICAIVYFLVLCGKLTDKKWLLGPLFLCAILMIVAVIIMFVKKIINVVSVVVLCILITAIILVVQILMELGFVQG